MTGLPTPSPAAAHDDLADQDAFTCQACGACCAYSAEWPRFALEDETALARIPSALVDDAHGRMRCDGDRCRALAGDVGIATACTIYEVRPDVCRACLPGDDACAMARQRFNLPPLPAVIADQI